MHQPGIEPGSVPWQGTILPLDHWCFLLRVVIRSLFLFKYFATYNKSRAGQGYGASPV